MMTEDAHVPCTTIMSVELYNYCMYVYLTALESGYQLHGNYTGTSQVPVR
jgi:hypothetical protein